MSSMPEVSHNGFGVVQLLVEKDNTRVVCRMTPEKAQGFADQLFQVAESALMAKEKHGNQSDEFPDNQRSG